MAPISNAADGRTVGPEPLPAIDAELLDVRTLAAMFGCSTRHVWRLSDNGRMPRPVRLGQLVRWRRTDVAQWIKDGCPAVRGVNHD